MDNALHYVTATEFSTYEDDAHSDHVGVAEKTRAVRTDLANLESGKRRESNYHSTAFGSPAVSTPSSSSQSPSHALSTPCSGNRSVRFRSYTSFRADDGTKGKEKIRGSILDVDFGLQDTPAPAPPPASAYELGPPVFDSEYDDSKSGRAEENTLYNGHGYPHNNGLSVRGGDGDEVPRGLPASKNKAVQTNVASSAINDDDFANIMNLLEDTRIGREDSLGSEYAEWKADRSSRREEDTASPNAPTPQPSLRTETAADVNLEKERLKRVVGEVEKAMERERRERELDLQRQEREMLLAPREWSTLDPSQTAGALPPRSEDTYLQSSIVSGMGYSGPQWGHQAPVLNGNLCDGPTTMFRRGQSEVISHLDDRTKFQTTSFHITSNTESPNTLPPLQTSLPPLQTTLTPLSAYPATAPSTAATASQYPPAHPGAPSSYSHQSNYSSTMSSRPNISGDRHQSPVSSSSAATTRNEPRRVVVWKSYTPSDSSMLTLCEGDIVEVISQAGENWGCGNLNGTIGVFPMKNVTDI